MKILAVWDNESEAELISMYLGVDENELKMTTTAAEFQKAIESGEPADVVFMPIGLPDTESGYKLFETVRQRYPDAPVVGACPAADVFRVVQFMANGMSAYVTRDYGGNYMFMLRAILQSTVDAVRAAREKELARKLREEIQSVRKLQESVIPKKLLAPQGYRICGRYEPPQLRVMGGQPVTMAGGDYFNVFKLADDSIAMLVGDAAGHGMKSCMSIMTMHALVALMRRKEYQDTAHFVNELNNILCEQSIVTEKGGFITLLYAILHAQTRTLEWSAAGHKPPLLHNLSTGSIEPLADEYSGGMPLALSDDEVYESYSVSLPDEFRLLLYTDGLEEAFPEGDDKNQFGVDGIVRVLRACSDRSLDDTLARLFQASDEFSGGNGRHDDMSVLLLEHRL